MRTNSTGNSMTIQKQEIGQIFTTSSKNLEDLTNLSEITIRPPSGRVSLELRELLEYRELLFFFIWRDIKIRYKQTVLGTAWAVIQPFLTMVVFSIFFGW